MYNKQSSEKNISILPTKEPAGSVIWLHGLGADGNDFAPIVPELKLQESLPLRFIFPHAPFKPVTINNGYVMRAWFDIKSLEIDQKVDEKEIQDAVKLIEDYISSEESLGIPTEKIILAGFSQGAVIALLTGLTFQKRLGGVIALSGFLPHTERILKEASKANRSMPIFIGHGTEDTIVSYQLGHMTADVLNKHHYNVTEKYYTMPHSVCPEEINDIAKWLNKIYNLTPFSTFN